MDWIHCVFASQDCWAVEFRNSSERVHTLTSGCAPQNFPSEPHVGEQVPRVKREGGNGFAAIVAYIWGYILGETYGEYRLPGNPEANCRGTRVSRLPRRCSAHWLTDLAIWKGERFRMSGMFDL